eukprot:CAMPEP_0177751358 /NCGR_PEP_ID=MMETSP0491_2-20121128/330_1 /TAXON_ID=63592 /ORGANISM="Tetraselmis chuii, Strain PLY429" /LENGTH=45 /DNA_ID= /DNA_START= /DNA_END= /DNA_ORIENTATION=
MALTCRPYPFRFAPLLCPTAYDPEVQRMMDENRRLKEEAQRRGLM